MITTYTSFKRKMKSYLDEATSGKSPLYVKRASGGNIVILAESEYSSIMETLHLLKSPKNATRLLRAIEQYEQEKREITDLIE
jgi:antitoxin YefM